MSASSIQCIICSKDFQIDELISNGKCKHLNCRKCLVEYVTKNLKVKIECPVSNCFEIIKDNVVRKCLSNNLTKVFDQISLSNASFEIKKCPIKECSFVYYAEENIGIFDCTCCNSPICIKCNNIHYSQDCGKGIQNDLLKKATENIKQKKREELSKLDKEYDLLPNPNPYECSFCSEFILPRNGVILRNCLHCFCQQCLKDTYSSKNFTNQLKCQKCNVRLQDKELRVLIEEKRFVAMVTNDVLSTMYHCKGADCPWVCHLEAGTKSFVCVSCNKVNCVECQDIHTGMTCEQFRDTRKYINSAKEREILKKEIHTNCLYCSTLLIQRGGCGSLHCPTCGNHICVFTGLFAGIHDPMICGCYTKKNCPREGKYCNCRTYKKCDSRCQYGCIPED